MKRTLIQAFYDGISKMIENEEGKKERKLSLKKYFSSTDFPNNIYAHVCMVNNIYIMYYFLGSAGTGNN